MKNEIKNYILEASLSNPEKVKNDTLIFESGLLDSMGLLFLIEFLNKNYKIEVIDEELNPRNFESINSITSFVEEKLKIIKNIKN
jgi:acyl carrier protein